MQTSIVIEARTAIERRGTGKSAARKRQQVSYKDEKQDEKQVRINVVL